MKTHIEDISADDLGMKGWLYNWHVKYATPIRKGSNTKFHIGVLPETLKTMPVWTLNEALPTLVFSEYELLMLQVRLRESEDFANWAYYMMHDALQRFHREYTDGEWRGWHTYVKPASFLQWAQSQKMYIPDPLQCLLEQLPPTPTPCMAEKEPAPPTIKVEQEVSAGNKRKHYDRACFAARIYAVNRQTIFDWDNKKGRYEFWVGFDASEYSMQAAAIHRNTELAKKREGRNMKRPINVDNIEEFAGSA